MAIARMAEDLRSGWVVMVGSLPEVRYYDVAIADPGAAVAAVRQLQGLPADVEVVAAAHLPERTVQDFGLAAGEIRRR